MLASLQVSRRAFRQHVRLSLNAVPRLPPQHRSLLTLAIETSCDDTSVAILEKGNGAPQGGPAAVLHFHEKVTANNDAFNGIHPIVALESHQSSLGHLVKKALQHLPIASPVDGAHTNSSSSPAGQSNNRRVPGFISVTRGPGMRSNLSVGLDTAKGLSLAWNIPLIGVHHMQAHALTPRLVSALFSKANSPPQPDFPFLSLLVSGGHSMLIS